MGECETRPPDLILLLKVLLLAGGSGAVIIEETVSIDATAMDANGKILSQ